MQEKKIFPSTLLGILIYTFKSNYLGKVKNRKKCIFTEKQKSHLYLLLLSIYIRFIYTYIFRSEEFESNGAVPCGLFNEAETTVEGLIDITASLDLKVSSRVAMVASLNDNSTETFWESCEEDRNKCKWVMASVKEAEANKIRIKSLVRIR